MGRVMQLRWEIAVLLWAASGPFLLGQDARTPATFDRIWEYPTPGEFPQGLVCDALRRPLLHVAMKNGGLHILDISAKTKAPQRIARLGTDQFADLEVMHLTQRGEYLYLALGSHFNARGSPAGLAVVHVKDPKHPRVTALWKSTQTLSGAAVVVVDGRYAYLGAMSEGVMIFDVSTADKIQPVATFLPEIHFPRKNPNKVQHPNARGLFLAGNRLYVAFDAGGLRVLDVSDRKNPRELGRYANPAMAHKQQAYNHVYVEGDQAYLPVDYAGFEIVDVKNPRAIRLLGWWNPWEAHTLKNIWFNSPGHTNQIAFDASKKLAYLSAGDSELQVIDVSDPTRPRLAGSYGKPKDNLGAWGLTISADRIYLSYITAVVPFRSDWAGIKALKR